MIRTFGWNEIWYLLLAARWTIALALMAFTGGIVGGLLIAILRTSPFRLLRWLAVGFIQLVQATPLLMQLFIWYYGVNLFGLRVDAWTAVALGMTFYASAFFGEIWRGALQAIPKTQWEASAALSLNYLQQLRYVIAPQALRMSLPPTVGFLVQIVKSTSLAAIVGFTELTKAGQLINNVTFSPLSTFGMVALIYFLICWPLSMTARSLERKLDVLHGHTRRL
ncbi:amino acid ABC transporter permease [Bradyrhizobium prioriisuperbiae]|uniref:amino acid ABC transporter permease n=1 Tax=Bradyrhizobium prioriisuperbiae TaxID=2854389 RepID=UPI0028E3E327|nr:amino acid ABC transporter permease [Bradyrhizobium prioritasuperba]